jgi:hypothetical protein
MIVSYSSIIVAIFREGINSVIGLLIIFLLNLEEIKSEIQIIFPVDDKTTIPIPDFETIFSK